MKLKTIKELRRIKKAILASPEKLNMKWFDGCIAGYCVGLKKSSILEPHVILKHAREKLGIDEEQSYILFNVNRWPHDYHSRYLCYGGISSNSAEVTAERIEYFIETGK